MEKDKLIHKFLDGELSAEQESEMFFNLSSDDDMRMELKEQLAIKNAIKGDLKAATPKAASTMAIFSELGFTPPPAANIPNPGSAVTSPMSKFLTAFSKYSGFVWTGLSTAATTALVMLLFLEPGIFAGNFGDNTNISQNNVTIENTEPVTNANIPVIESKETSTQEQNATAQKSQDNVVYKYIYITKEKPNENTVSEVENIVRDIHSSDLSNNYQLSLDSKVMPVYDAELGNSFADNSDLALDGPQTPELTSSSYGIIVEFKTAKDWTNSNGLNPSQYQDWNNTSLGLFKELSSEIAVGVEYRRENYYLDFKGIEGGDQLYQYEVYPNTGSITAALRYSPDYLKWYDFSPMLQLSLGANNVGPVGRFFIGTQYSPTDSYSLIFGIDGSAMRYNFQNTDYTSKKYGIQFGASFRF